MVKVHGSDAAKTPNIAKAIDLTAAEVLQGQGGPRDVIEISVAARLAARLRELPDVREDLVARIKAEIRKGTYETDEKFEAAIDKLMEELLPDA